MRPEIKKHVDILQNFGYIVITKIELDRIINGVKLGKTIRVDRFGKPVGFVEV
jgi:hypothetical protein